MDDTLRIQANEILNSAPCSIEMPAGTGKTHLLAAVAAIAGEKGRRSLILTHTNAGVDAIRTRLKEFGVRSDSARVDTITGWAFILSLSYARIAGLIIPGVPDWTRSREYVVAASRVADANAIVRVHELSFSYLLVDEYQDCSTSQHALVTALSKAIPRTVLFGDRLQAIFRFDDQDPLVDWDQDVLPAFPEYKVAVVPHRWRGHNEALGTWMLEIRGQLVAQGSFNALDHQVEGLKFVSNSQQGDIASVAFGFSGVDESVVLLDKWPSDVAGHASRLKGIYSVMEELQGKFMRQALEQLPPDGDYRLAHWLGVFAKNCAIGLADLDAPIMSRLLKNQGITRYSRRGITDILEALEAVRSDPTYERLLRSAEVLKRNPGVRIYRWEGWRDTLAAIRATIDNREPPADNLARIRDRLRYTGRVHGGSRAPRVASRILLVKGLEYDHVVIANLANFDDPRDLYVALSRARKTVTIMGRSHRITF